MASSSFTYQLASDVIRDGMALEMLDLDGVVVAEVFRSDAAHSVELQAFREDIPDGAIRDLAAAAIERLGPFEDGKPLSAALNYATLLKASIGRSNKSLERTRER
ncbi:MAG TPA: hypothetical protein VGM97_20095 [Steroidobacteraceae bacterium]|jgi:hypothetical protein